MKRLLPLALTLALTLAGCGTPAAESPVSQPSEGINAPVETPAPTETSASTPKPVPTDGPYVYTDYSKLESDASRQNLYERWHGKFTDHLIPSPDYGPLIPFSGDGAEETWETAGCASQGLMTLEGKVVVDPVYSAVVQLSGGHSWSRGVWQNGSASEYYPTFLLSRYAGDGTGDLFSGHRDVLSSLCAADGSWVTRSYRFSYISQTNGVMVQNGAIFALRDKNVLCLLDISTGEELFSAALEGLKDEILNSVLDGAYYGDGRITLNVPIYSYNNNAVTETHYLRCWDINGREISLPDDVDVIYGFSEGLCPARRTGGTGYAWGYLGLDGAWAIPPQFTDAAAFENGVALVGSHAHTLIDREGNILYETPTYDHCQKTGDCWYFTGYSGDLGLVLDETGSEVASPLLHGGVVEVLNYGWAVMENPDGSHTLARGEKSWAIPKSWGDVWDVSVTEDTVYLYGWTEGFADGKPRWAIWKPEGGLAPTVLEGDFYSLHTDAVTGALYCVAYDDFSSLSTYRVTDAEGRPLQTGLSGWPNPRLYAGRCLTETDGDLGRTVELRDQGGKLLFRRWWEAPFD